MFGFDLFGDEGRSRRRVSKADELRVLERQGYR